MKKYANFNFITLLTIAAAFLTMAILVFMSTRGFSESLNELKNDISETSNSGEIDDVEGYGMIINSAAYGLGSLGNLIVSALFIKIPAALGIIILCLALITRFIFRKNILYSILTIITYILIFLSAGLYSLAFISSDEIPVKAAAVISMIYIIFITAAGLRNAFSKSLLNK